MDTPTLPKLERTITITLMETQCNHIANLFQAAVQAGGLAAAKVALPILDLLGAELQSAIVPADMTTPIPRPPRPANR
jgi:hypothetical protein